MDAEPSTTDLKTTSRIGLSAGCKRLSVGSVSGASPLQRRRRQSRGHRGETMKWFPETVEEAEADLARGLA